MKTIDTVKLSAAIRAKRGNMPLADLAKMLGISTSTLSRIERGSMPDLPTYLTVIDYIGVPAEFFQTDDNEPQEFTEREMKLIHEAFMSGRVYARQGEKETPAEIDKKLINNCKKAIGIG